ncbi:hypothetical protein DFH28DRAFT_931808 [Melampsora americana]|nr:hypothetical protein DFH28DRAFT_931808 [Melampsora americana]
MVKLQPLLVPHREALLSGRIIGFSSARKMWSVEVTGVNITAGHENGTASNLPLGGSQLGTPGGRARGKLFIPEATRKNLWGKVMAGPSSSRQSNKKAHLTSNAKDSLIDP